MIIVILFVIVRLHFVSVFTIKKPKGASAARAHDVLMLKLLDKCILNIFKSDWAQTRLKTLNVIGFI